MFKRNKNSLKTYFVENVKSKIYRSNEKGKTMFGSNDISYEELQDAFADIEYESEEAQEETVIESQEEEESSESKTEDDALETTKQPTIEDDSSIENEDESNEDESEEKDDDSNQDDSINKASLIERFLDDPEGVINSLVDDKLQKR